MTLTEDLMSLYRVDSQLRGLRTRVENASDLVAIRKRKFAKLTAEHEEVATRLRQLQAHVANLEGESTDYKNRIEKTPKRAERLHQRQAVPGDPHGDEVARDAP